MRHLSHADSILWEKSCVSDERECVSLFGAYWQADNPLLTEPSVQSGPSILNRSWYCTPLHSIGKDVNVSLFEDKTDDTESIKLLALKDKPQKQHLRSVVMGTGTHVSCRSTDMNQSCGCTTWITSVRLDMWKGKNQFILFSFRIKQKPPSFFWSVSLWTVGSKSEEKWHSPQPNRLYEITSCCTLFY